MVDQIPDPEDACELRPCRGLLADHVALVIEIHLAFDQIRQRRMPDRDERTPHLELLLLPGLGVLHRHLGDLAVLSRDELGRCVRRHELDVLPLSRTVLHDLGGSEFVASVDDGQLAGELGDEDRVLHCRVPTSDHHDLLIFEKGSVTYPASRDTHSLELLLAGDPKPFGLGTHRQDHRLGAMFLAADNDGLHLAVGQTELGRIVGDEAGPESLGLCTELAHHRRSHDSLGVARIVLDIGGVLQLTTPGKPLHDERFQLGPGRVQGRRVTGRTPSDHDHVFYSLFSHRKSILTRAAVPPPSGSSAGRTVP